MYHGQNMEVKKLLLSVIGRDSIQVGLISIQFPYNVVGFSSMSYSLMQQ